MSEPPIHVVSPQPADFYAAAPPHCFILHAVNLFKSVIFFCNGDKNNPERFRLRICGKGLFQSASTKDKGLLITASTCYEHLFR